MSTEDDLDSLRLLTGFLSNHTSQVMRVIWSLNQIECIIIHDHQPSFRRGLGEPRLGYSCFASAGEETLKNILDDLKVVIKPVRILLKRKGPWSKVLNSICFSAQEILELRRISGALGGLVMQERLTGYIPYMLNKFRTVSEWRNSQFAKMKWTEISAALANGDDSLDLLVSKVAYSLVYDVRIVKKWIQLGSNLWPKDTYIARCVKNHDTDGLHLRVWRDEAHLEYIAFWHFKRSGWIGLRFCAPGIASSRRRPGFGCPLIKRRWLLADAGADF